MQSRALCNSGQFGGEEKAGAKSASGLSCMLSVLILVYDNTHFVGFGIISKMCQAFCGEMILV